MPHIDVSEEVYAALHRMTTDSRQSTSDVLAALLKLPGGGLAEREPLAAYLLSPEFRAKFTDADKYLAILGWIGARHAAELQEFIFSLGSGRRYLSQSREAILSQCRHNQARQIPGTHYWAIMNIDTPTKRRFLSRILEFCGYRDELIDLICNAIGMRRTLRQLPF